MHIKLKKEDGSVFWKLQAVFAASVMVLLSSGCIRTIEYNEEVLLGNPPKIEIVKRREIQELLINQLSPKWTFSRSEILLFGKTEAVWSAHLRPMYLEKLPSGDGYLLVSAINSATECIKRGRPISYYITAKITPEKTIEIPTPSRLEGKAANLLWSTELLPKGENIVSIKDKEQGRYTRIGGLSETELKLLLTSNFGC